MKIELIKTIGEGKDKIVIRAMEIKEGDEKDGTYLVEMITKGCVICFWRARKVDGCYFLAELNEVHDRLTSVEIDKETLFEAISIGRKIADVIITCYFTI